MISLWFHKGVSSTAGYVIGKKGNKRVYLKAGFHFELREYSYRAKVMLHLVWQMTGFHENRGDNTNKELKDLDDTYEINIEVYAVESK